MCRCGNLIIRNPANLICGVFGFAILVYLFERNYLENMSNYCFFIIPNILSSAKGDLSAGERIVKFPLNWPFTLKPSGSDGPFFNLKDLLEQSILYKNLKKTNPKRAHKIIQKEYIITAKDFSLFNKNISLEEDFINSINHSVKGKIQNEKLKGVHYYDENKIKIIEVLKINERGVWSAIIEKLNDEGKWIKKNSPSSFFPKEWTIGQLYEEIIETDNNKTKKENSENIYESYTKSGIKVEIVIVNGKRKTIYPVI